MDKGTKNFWELDKQKNLRKDLIQKIDLGDHLLSDEDYDVDFSWLKEGDIEHLATSEDSEF